MHQLTLLLCLGLGIAPLLSAVGASSVVGSTTVCLGGTNIFSVTTDSLSGIYAWSIGTNNTAGAFVVGEVTNTTVLVVAPTNGVFDLECAVDVGGSNEIATANVIVPALIAASPLTNQLACSGGSVTFTTTITSDAGYSILWRKDGNVILDATNASLTLSDLSLTNVGTYCIEVAGACNSITNCATLDLAPTATLGGPSNLVLQCLTEVPAPDTNSVTATNAVAVFFLSDAAATNGCEISITRTYAAVNSCGATSTCAQLILVQDTTAPVLIAPSNRVVEAGATWDFDQPTVLDNCSGTNVTLIVSSTVTNPLCGLTFAATRTWSAMDACSNVAVASQTITIIDSTPPVFTGLTNQVLEFGTAWNFITPHASDVADGTNLLITVTSTTTNAQCGNTFTATRTWQTTDSCSNAATFSQTVVVLDTLSPVLAGETNRIIEFGATWDFLPPTATDIADGTNVSMSVTGDWTNSLCGNTFEAVRTWTATDSCSNSASFTQTVTVHDTTPPTFTGANYLTNEFGSVWDFVAPTASDIADGTNLTITVSGVTTNPLCGNTFEAVRTWTATDSCSNSASFTQTVTVHDTTPPVFTGANYLTNEFGSAWDFVPPTASDIADGTNLTITVSGVTTNPLCGNTFEAVRTWTATDSCNNSASFTQTVTVHDTTPPTFTGANYLTNEFGGAWDFVAPTASDVADGTNLTITVGGVTTNPLCGNTFEAVRTWTATDSCSNSASFTQTVTVHDTTPPVFTGVTNLVFECGSVWSFQPPTVYDIADGTNLLLVVTNSFTNFLCGSTLVATQTWYSIDSCSNAATFSQFVTIVDTAPPVFSPLTNHTIECGQPLVFDIPTADDICGGTNVAVTIFNTTTNPLVGETFASTRVWLATDPCGNTNFTSQTVTIVDTTPPTIFTPSNIVVECAGGAGNIVNYTVTAFDGCDTNVTLTVTPPSGSAFTLGTNTVICTAVDDSGNTNQASFLVIVQDTTPPTIFCPANMIVSEAPRNSGGAVVNFAPPTVVDTCDGTPTISCSPTNGSFFPNGTNVVTWTAVDGSGNSNSCTFTVRVIPYVLTVVSTSDTTNGGSLRQAILDGNDAPDDNLIVFALPGSGTRTLNLSSPLPPVTSAAIIDGWSQGNSNQPPAIELVGSSNAFDGLVIKSGRSTVRGLALRGFATALRLEGGTNVIQGNYIGVSLVGSNLLANTGDGLYIRSASNQIGGTIASAANRIGNNGRNGITFDTASAHDNLVRGNFIGILPTGPFAAPNGGHGIFMTNAAAANRIGGMGAGEPNQIGINIGAGVALDATAGNGNAILANIIVNNLGLGIDLGATGVTANDLYDADAGPNRLQNFPVLSDVRSASGVTVIEGSLSSAPNSSYTIQFFLNSFADPSGYGEGSTYLGSIQVNTDANGDTAFSHTIALNGIYTQFITATATDGDGNTSEFSAARAVRTPPVIDAMPVSTNAVPGQPVTFCAHATGTAPIQYQWRLNGVNILGATNECYSIPSANVGNGGTYSVIIGNALDTFATASASLILGGTNILALPVGDNFTNAVNISSYNAGTNGTLVGNNTLATLELLEPLHAGKPGGHSVWYRWQPPHDSRGIATIRTTGSTFDTLLAVYEGRSVTNLTEIASDEDDGQFYASEVRFNAWGDDHPFAYYVAVDGFGGGTGEFVLSWNMIKTSHMLPAILTQPAGATVTSGSGVSFNVSAVPVCPEGHLDCNQRSHWSYNNSQKEILRYQWYYENAPIPGATNTTYAIPTVLPENTGNYFVRVFTPWQFLDSRIVSLQIGSQSVQAVDKFIDALTAGALHVGDPTAGAALAAPIGSPSMAAAPMVAAGTVVRGYTGSQIFNTTGSATDPNEVICGALGGSSEWITIVAEQTGTLFLNTDGTSYDTVMAVFIRNPTNAAALQYITCDNNSGQDGKDSAVSLPVQAGSTNYVVVDGVNGAVGTLYLNYSLATTTIISVAGKSAEGANIVQINGRPGLNFKIQSSSDLKAWDTLVTTTAPSGILNYTDLTSIGVMKRFYRVLILP